MSTQPDILERLVQAKAVLRDENRVKFGTDYSLTVKYGEVHVMCQIVYAAVIEGVFIRHQIPIASLHAYK